MYFFTVEASIELQMSVIMFYDIITLKKKQNPQTKILNLNIAIHQIK